MGSWSTEGSNPSPSALYFHFASAEPHLSERELDTLTELDPHSSDALLATDPKTGDVVGVARFAALPDKDGAVDVAVTRHLARHATALAENTPSIAMLRRAGFASRLGTGSLREFELAFTEPRGRENP